jgi:hypothetical protein
VLFCVMCVICVLSYCSALPPGKNPFAVKINNNKIIIIHARNYRVLRLKQENLDDSDYSTDLYRNLRPRIRNLPRVLFRYKPYEGRISYVRNSIACTKNFKSDYARINS